MPGERGSLLSLQVTFRYRLERGVIVVVVLALSTLVRLAVAAVLFVVIVIVTDDNESEVRTFLVVPLVILHEENVQRLTIPTFHLKSAAGNDVLASVASPPERTDIGELLLTVTVTISVLGHWLPFFVVGVS